MALNSKSLAKVRRDVPTKAAMTGELVRFNVIIDKATRKQWKTEALARETSVADMLREAMRQYLSKD